MRRAYQLGQWRRRMETIHAKAVALSYAIEEVEGKSENYDAIMNVVVAAAEAVDTIKLTGKST
jgi:hypothetical protein